MSKELEKSQKFMDYANSFKCGYVKLWKAHGILTMCEQENMSTVDLIEYIKSCLIMEGFTIEVCEKLANWIENNEYPWGSLSVSEKDGLEVIKKSYGHNGEVEDVMCHRFTIMVDGTIAALVAGDMGYDATHITIARKDIIALVEDWPEFKK